MMRRYEGVVGQFYKNEGDGYITYKDNLKVFFHDGGINRDDYKSIKIGTHVTFDIITFKNEVKIAINIK